MKNYGPRRVGGSKMFDIPIDIFKQIGQFAANNSLVCGSSLPKSHKQGYLNFIRNS